MNLLEFAMQQAEKAKLPKKSELSAIMSSGDEDLIAEVWEKIYAAGGYDALED